MNESLNRPELATTLLRLRQDAGLSGIEAARRVACLSRLCPGWRPDAAPPIKDCPLQGMPGVCGGPHRIERHRLTMHARHAFHVYDTHTVIVGTESGTAFITDPVEVGAHDRRSAELEDVAVFGDQAVDVFERVAEDYRALYRRR